MEGDIDFYKHASFDLASKLSIHYYNKQRESEVPYLFDGYEDTGEQTRGPKVEIGSDRTVKLMKLEKQNDSL